jgi:hypothetical protein
VGTVDGLLKGNFDEAVFGRSRGLAMKLATIAIILLVTTPCCRAQCSSGTGSKRSDLTILPLDTSKSLSDQDAFVVKEFVDLRSNIDRSGLFGRHVKGHIDNYSYYAAQVPFGRYRIKLQSKSGSASFGRLIDVCQQDEKVEIPSQFARVHIVPLITSYSSVKDGPTDLVTVTKFQNALDGTEMSGLFKGAFADQIPYGSYDLEFILPLGLIKREVDIFQPDVWVFSGSGGGIEDKASSGPGNVVRGEVRNIPANEKPVFMIMSGVYIPYTINSVVSEADSGNGTFSFIGVNPYSEFMLYTIGKSGVLDARMFKLPRDSEIVIDLSQPSPPKKDLPNEDLTGVARKQE